MNNLAVAYQYAGKFDLAIPLYAETLAIKKVKLGPDHRETLATMHNLGWGYQHAGQFDLALPLLEETLARKKAKFGSDHPDTLTTLSTLGTGYQDAGRLDLAIPTLEECVRRRKAPSFGRRSPRYPLHHERPRHELPRRRPAQPRHPAPRGDIGEQEGQVRPRPCRHARQHGQPRPGLSGRGPPRPRRCRSWSRPHPSGSGRRPGPVRPGTRTPWASSAWSSSNPGCGRHAESTLRECLAIQELRQPDEWLTFNTRSVLGGALLGHKRYDEAGPLLRAGYEGMARRADKILLRDRVRAREALERLIAFADATNKPDDAKEWNAERAKWPANPPKPGTEKNNRAPRAVPG